MLLYISNLLYIWINILLIKLCVWWRMKKKIGKLQLACWIKLTETQSADLMYRSWYFKKKICAQFAVLTSDKLPVGLVTSCQCKYLHILHKLLITKDTSIYYISCFSHRKVGGKKTIIISEHCLKPQRTSIYRVHASWKKSQVAVGLATNCIQVVRWTGRKYITEYLSISEHQLK